MHIRPSSVVARVLVGVAACAVLACSTSQYHSSTTCSAYGLTNAGFDKPIEFRCLAGLELVRASLACETGGGTMSWSLRDPAGHERWQGTTSGELEVVQTFEPLPGVWTMKLSGVEVTGFYRLAVTGWGGSILDIEVTGVESQAAAKARKN